MIECTACKTQNTVEARYCQNCQAKLPRPADAQVVKKQAGRLVRISIITGSVMLLMMAALYVLALFLR